MSDLQRLMQDMAAVFEQARVPTDGRMIWPEPHLLRPLHTCKPLHVYKPRSPAEVNAFMQQLLDDDIECTLRSTWRERPLVTALRGIYP
jgi:hypothetical protein